MPAFNFSPVKGNKTKRTNNNTKKSYNIIKSKVIGIVWIDRKAEYYILVDNTKKYYIHPKCYSCVGKQQLYRQGEFDDSNFVYIRFIDNLIECNRYYWLPFGIGCVVCGKIVIENGIKYFIIDKCDVVFNNEDSHKAMEFYLEHITEINRIIISKRNEDR